jgi:hypothetical protein
LDTPFGKGLVAIKQLELTERVFWREMDESKGNFFKRNFSFIY